MEDSLAHAVAAPAARLNGTPGENASVSVWPEEVLTLADQQNLRPYLEPMLKATHAIFPTARWIKVYTKPDPEIPGERAIIFDVQIAGLTSAQCCAADKAWSTELLRILPRPRVNSLYLLLDAVQR
jgi:hypothetical protein